MLRRLKESVAGELPGKVGGLVGGGRGGAEGEGEVGWEVGGLVAAHGAAPLDVVAPQGVNGGVAARQGGGFGVCVYGG